MKKFLIIAKRGLNTGTCFLTTVSDLPSEDDLVAAQKQINKGAGINSVAPDRFIVIDFKEISND